MVDVEKIKALHCLASQLPDGDCRDCYMDEHNRRRKKHGLPKMYCKKGGKSGIQCPYYQDKYGVCMEDFECNEWLEDIARSLERWVIPAKLIVETLDEDVKVGNMIFKAGTKIYYCPECFGIISGAQNFCGRCGKRIEL